MGHLEVVDSTFAPGPFFAIPPFVSYTTTVTSADTLYAKNYLNDLDQDTPWRSTSTAQQDIDIDLGAPVVNPVVYIFGANFETATLFLDDEATFTAPPVTSAISIYKYIPTKIRKGWFRLTGTYQYLRCRITASQATDGNVAYYQIGEIIVAASSNLVIPQARHQLPIDFNKYRPQLSVQYPGNGSRAVVNMGRRRTRIQLPNQGFHVDDEEKIWTISDADENQNFLFFANLYTPTVQVRTLDTTWVYLVKMIGETSVTSSYDLLETGWLLEEQ